MISTRTQLFHRFSPISHRISPFIDWRMLIKGMPCNLC